MPAKKSLHLYGKKNFTKKILISLLLIAPAKNIVSDKHLIRLKTSKSLLFLGEVFLGAPDRNFFLVPSLVAIMLPTFLVDNLPFLRPQHLRLQQSQTLPSLTKSSPSFFFNLYLLLTHFNFCNNFYNNSKL